MVDPLVHSTALNTNVPALHQPLLPAIEQTFDLALEYTSVVQAHSPVHRAFCAWGNIDMAEDCATGDDEARGILEIIAVDIEILVAVHIDGEAFRGEAESERNAVIVGFHLAFLIESVAEDGLAYVIVARDISLDLWKSTRVCHVGQQRVVEGCGEVRPSLRLSLIHI